MLQKLRSFVLAVFAAFIVSASLAPLDLGSAFAQSTDAAAPASAVVNQTAPSAAKVDNPYGLSALWAGSDFVAKSVLVIMVVMSMGSWYIIITKIIEQAKMNKQAREATDNFWKTGSIEQGAQALAEGSPYRYIASAGLEATKKHDGLLGQVDFNTWVTMSIQRAMERVQSRMQDGLAFLATVGSTAPFVGLFGTVWGIYHALTAIGVAGQASIDKVAGPVGEALIMTAIGLAVAVPAVLGYNWLVRRNKGVMDEVRSFGNDLHAVLLAQAAKKS
ncbi:MAG: MotA/TolQ/ExbB proton channel family protein [Burkholderiales bacterium]|nr:MotA/TolQ/ExbB proton channel family protein [Burkholderiales bacterium]